MPDKWWYDVIKKALDDLKEGVGFQDVMYNYVETMRQQIMFQIEHKQPYGHEEFDPLGYYAAPDYLVSTRLGHTSIANGWQAEIGAIEDVGLSWMPRDWFGIRLKINNVSEHIRWVIEGTFGHDEGSEKTIFWWGDPHPWPQPEDKSPGYFRFAHINHPGQEPNPFVEKSSDAARGGMTELNKTGVSEFLTKLMTDAGLRAI